MKRLSVISVALLFASQSVHATILDTYYNHPRGGIYKVGSSGVVSSVLSDSATGLDVGMEQYLYFSEFSRYKGDLMMMSPDKQVAHLATIYDDPDPIGLKAWNIDIAVNNSGEIYYNHPRGGIYKVDSSGEVSSVLSDSATGLTFDGNGNLFYCRYSRYKGYLVMMSSDQQIKYLATIYDDPDPIAIQRWNIDVATIPEPATLLLLGLGAVMMRRRTAVLSFEC